MLRPENCFILPAVFWPDASPLLLPMDYFHMSASGLWHGAIRSVLLIMRGIRYASPCLRSEPVAGLAQDCIREHQIKYRLLSRILFFLQYQKN